MVVWATPKKIIFIFCFSWVQGIILIGPSHKNHWMIGLSQNIIIFLNMCAYWGLINISRDQQWHLKTLFSSLSLKPQCKHCHNMCLYPKFLNHAQLWVVLYIIIIINAFSWVVLLLLLIIIINFFETWVCNLRLLCL